MHVALDGRGPAALLFGMAKIINMNRFKKQQARAERRAEAAENAVRHGQPGSVKRAREAQRERDEARLDGKRLDE